MKFIYWLTSPISYALNFLDDSYKTLKRMLNTNTSTGKYLTNKGKDLDIVRHHHIDRIMRIRCFNSVDMHETKGSVNVLEEECGNLNKIQSKVMGAIGGLFSKVIIGKETEIFDNFARADGSLGSDWDVIVGSMSIESQQVREDGAGSDDARATHQTPISTAAIQFVQAELDLTNLIAGVAGFDLYIRGQAKDSSNKGAYWVKYQTSSNTFIFGYKDSAGSEYVFGSSISYTLTKTKHFIRVTAENVSTGVKISFWLNETYMGSAIDTANNYPSGNYVGFRINNVNNTSNDIQADNFKAGIFSVPEEYKRAIANISAIEIEDNFDRADTTCVKDAGVGLGSNWVVDAVVDRGLHILLNRATATGCSYTRGFASHITPLSSYDQAVQADFIISANPSPGSFQLSLRQLTTSAFDDRYYLFWVGDHNELRIMKKKSGSADVQIAVTSYDFYGETRTVRFEARTSGNDVVLEAYVDGELVISHTDSSDVILGKYCGFYIDIGAVGFIICDNFKAGLPGGFLKMITQGTPAIILSPWIRHMIVYDEDEKVLDDGDQIQDLVIYLTLNNLVAENTDDGKVYLWYDSANGTVYFFKDQNRRTQASWGWFDPLEYAIAKAANIISGVERYFVEPVNDTGIFGVLYLNQSSSEIRVTYHTKRHKLSNITNKYIPLHTTAFLDGYRKLDVAPYGIIKIGNGLTFSNFTVDPAGCIEDETTYFRLKAGYENQQITITSNSINLTIAGKNFLLDIVYWMRVRITNYFRIEVRHADSSGGLATADWREFENNSNIRYNGELKIWHQFRIKFMVKEVEDIIIENFIIKQVLEYLNNYFD